MTKASPGSAADPSNPHLFDVYRFENPTTAPVCFNFELTYGEIGIVDAGLDAATPEAGVEGDPDASASDAAVVVPVIDVALQKYLTAYGTFFPTDISLDYLADVGVNATLGPPQTMGVTVPAGDTIDVVVYGISVAPAGVGSYTLSCSTQ